MRGIDVRSALCEQHRRELLAEAERQRLFRSLPRHQRSGGILVRAARAGWEMIRQWRFKKASVSGKKGGRHMLVRYYPVSDWDLNRRN